VLILANRVNKIVVYPTACDLRFWYLTYKAVNSIPCTFGKCESEFRISLILIVPNSSKVLISLRRHINARGWTTPSWSSCCWRPTGQAVGLATAKVAGLDRGTYTCMNNLPKVVSWKREAGSRTRDLGTIGQLLLTCSGVQFSVSDSLGLSRIQFTPPRQNMKQTGLSCRVWPSRLSRSWLWHPRKRIVGLSYDILWVRPWLLSDLQDEQEASLSQKPSDAYNKYF